jgi:acylphosphatase
MQDSRRAIRCLVSGRVQGVGYRAATASKGRALGLQGIARNLPDGRVEVIACGTGEALAELVRWLWEGPPLAGVSGVDIEDVPLDSLHLAEPGFVAQ